MPNDKLPHLSIVGFTKSQSFKSPQSLPIKLKLPQRQPLAHGRKLLARLRAIEQQIPTLRAERTKAGLSQGTGLSIALEVSPAKYFLPTSVEWKRDNIEVLSFTEIQGSGVAVLHVPYGKLSAFEKRVREYMAAPQAGKKRAHMRLISVVDDIRGASFQDLWTEEEAPPPLDPQLHWFQMWLRTTGHLAEEVYKSFKQTAPQLEIFLEPGYVRFPGRIVVAVRATRLALESAATLLDYIAEIRNVQPTAGFFLADTKPHEQADWVQSLVDRTNFADSADSTRLTLLDTGVNSAHPLLSPALVTKDTHAFDAEWGTSDHDGHGTEMAGIAVYGDLVGPLASSEPVTLSHKLESVKILPPHGANPRHLYGDIMWQAAGRVEVENPTARRVYAMMTTEVGLANGSPTEWSATVDQITFGRLPIEVSVDDEPQQKTPRLFVLAAGNVPWSEWTQYPTINTLAQVESPGQSWNAITVGACTSLTDFDAKTYPEYEAIAQSGALSPSSTTGVLWHTPWPHKPDVVAEGGNGSYDGWKQVVVGPADLRLLTTSHQPTKSPLAETGDTSAAAAEVARVCATLTAQYPDYWPETVRALVVHGARYTAPMQQAQAEADKQEEKRALLRTYGFGQVHSDLSSFSTHRRATMVVQGELTPFARTDGSIRLGELRLHDLPWPDDALRSVPASSVNLRVTLSYFVEPNPSRRGWLSKFRYASHGLRFAIRAATETEALFLARINKLARAEETAKEVPAPTDSEVDVNDAKDKPSYSDPDVNGWDFGPQLRARGSIHSDVWRGTAADIASKGQIAVFPVGGWWKDWQETKQWSNAVRYSMVVTLEVSDDVTVDLYTPIQNILTSTTTTVDIVGDTSE